MTTQKMHRTQIYLPHSLYADLKAKSRECGKSLAEIIRHTLLHSSFSEREEKPQNVLCDLVKLGKREKFNLGKNVASRHDQYLYE